MAAITTATETTEESEKVSSKPAKLKRATLKDLLGKKPSQEEFSAPLGSGDAEISFLFVSIGARRYDLLLSKYPPTTEQRAGGASFNTDLFAPALLTEVCREPAIDKDGWTEVWNSDSWNRGEVAALFWKAVELCNSRVEVNPIEAG
jgi:hypothetical protein